MLMHSFLFRLPYLSVDLMFIKKGERQCNNESITRKGESIEKFQKPGMKTSYIIY